MFRRTAMALCAASWLIVSHQAFAAPELLQYQGRITDLAGTPRNAPVHVTFSIYGVEQGGAALWSQTFGSLPLDNGRFSVLLGGDGAPFTQALRDAIESGDDLFLGIRVGQDPEMQPRQQIASTVYSLHAGFAERASEADRAAEADHAAVADTADFAHEVASDVTIPELPGLSFQSTQLSPSVPPKTSRSAIGVEIAAPAPGFVVVGFGGTMVLKPQGGAVAAYVNAAEEEHKTPESTMGYVSAETPAESYNATKLFPFFGQRVFEVSAEGTYTYYMNVYNGGSLHAMWIEYPSITATFIPRSYAPTEPPPSSTGAPTGMR